MGSQKIYRFVFILLLGVILFSMNPLVAETIGNGKGKVIAVRILELKADVDTTEFEKFVFEEYNPAMKGVIPGLQEYVAKSDRGVNVGSYALFTIFDSQMVRDTMLPGDGRPMAEWVNTLMKEKGLWSRWNTLKRRYLVEGSTSKYNDFIVMEK